MTLSLLDEYMLPDMETFKPNKDTHLMAFQNWQQNDRCTCASISTAISKSKKITIGGAPRADVSKFWKTLTECHTKNGPIAQINLICEAMNLHATNETLMMAIDDICILMDQAFAMEEISNDTLINFAILQSYSNYQEIQLNIQWLLRTMMKTVLITHSKIHAIVQECINLMSDANSSAPTSIALVACSTSKNSKS